MIKKFKSRREHDSCFTIHFRQWMTWQQHGPCGRWAEDMRHRRDAVDVDSASLSRPMFAPSCVDCVGNNPAETCMQSSPQCQMNFPLLPKYSLIIICNYDIRKIHIIENYAATLPFYSLSNFIKTGTENGPQCAEEWGADKTHTFNISLSTTSRTVYWMLSCSISKNAQQ